MFADVEAYSLYAFHRLFIKIKKYVESTSVTFFICILLSGKIITLDHILFQIQIFTILLFLNSSSLRIDESTFNNVA